MLGIYVPTVVARTPGSEGFRRLTNRSLWPWLFVVCSRCHAVLGGFWCSRCANVGGSYRRYRWFQYGLLSRSAEVWGKKERQFRPGKLFAQGTTMDEGKYWRNSSSIQSIKVARERERGREGCLEAKRIGSFMYWQGKTPPSARDLCPLADLGRLGRRAHCKQLCTSLMDAPHTPCGANEPGSEATRGNKKGKAATQQSVAVSRMENHWLRQSARRATVPGGTASDSHSTFGSLAQFGSSLVDLGVPSVPPVPFSSLVIVSRPPL